MRSGSFNAAITQQATNYNLCHNILPTASPNASTLAAWLGLTESELISLSPSEC